MKSFIKIFSGALLFAGLVTPVGANIWLNSQSKFTSTKVFNSANESCARNTLVNYVKCGHYLRSIQNTNSSRSNSSRRGGFGK